MLNSRELREKSDPVPELRGHGFSAIVVGVIHFFVPALAWQAGVVLVVSGALCLVFRSRFLFILEGLVMAAIGVLNIVGSFPESNFWMYLGSGQIVSGGRTMQLAWQKYAPRFSQRLLESRLESLPTDEERAKTLIASLQDVRGFDVKKGVLQKLASMGETARTATTELRSAVTSKRTPTNLRVWYEYAIARIEGTQGLCAKKMGQSLAEACRVRRGGDEVALPDGGPLSESMEALADLGDPGVAEMLSLYADPAISMNVRCRCGEAVAKSLGCLTKMELRARIFATFALQLDQAKPLQQIASETMSLLSKQDGRSWIEWWKSNRPLILDAPLRTQADLALCRNVERHCSQCGERYYLRDFREGVEIFCTSRHALPRLEESLREFDAAL